MADDNPNSTDTNGGNGSEPSTEQHPVATAIQSLESQKHAARNNPTQYERESHVWAIRTGKGVILYTIFTAAIMVAGICAAIYSRQQAQTTREMEHKQLRAYVSAKVSQKGITNFVPDQIAELEIGIQNSGQTPALDLVTDAILFLRKYPLPETEDLTIPGTPTKTTSGLGITLHPRDIDFGTTLKRKIEPAIYEGLKITDIGRFYAFGTILYLDIFGVQHWTHFCYNFYGTGPVVTQWEACPRYNDTDKNE
jgi:hypothetical protein